MLGALPPSKKPRSNGEQPENRMKQENPIEEIWRIREEIAKEDGFDLQAHFQRLRKLEQSHPERMGSPRSAHSVPAHRVSEDPPP